MERCSEQERFISGIDKDSIAIVATGDELLCGQIINTNAAEISDLLHKNHYKIATHLTIADDINTISETLSSLIPLHKIIITTGGLGPTRDDITRDAIANASGRELVFDEENWQHIKEIINKIGRKATPSNKQQAYFPSGSEIIINNNGTASGCITPTEIGCIIMLPGPPHESMPMLRDILPKIADYIKPQKVFFKNWLLNNASESLIAEEINSLDYESQGVQIGYRAAYPYLEIKCWHDEEALFNKAISDIAAILIDKQLPYTENASEILYKKLSSGTVNLNIIDHATGGRLEQKLHSKKTNKHISFNDNSSNAHTYIISGLKEYWEDIDTSYTNLEIKNTNNNEKTVIKVRNIANKTLEYAAEQFCIYFLKSIYDE